MADHEVLLTAEQAKCLGVDQPVCAGCHGIHGEGLSVLRPDGAPPHPQGVDDLRLLTRCGFAADAGVAPDAGTPECEPAYAAGRSCDPASVGARCHYGASNSELGDGLCRCAKAVDLGGGLIGGTSWSCRVESCPFEAPDWWLCSEARAIEAGSTLTQQNTADGGHGECARSASGIGGPNLYYALTLPAGQRTRVIATSLVENEEPLLRVLLDCRTTGAEWSARGGKTCLINRGDEDLHVVLAVGRYSGEAMNSTVTFDLSVDMLPLTQACW